MTLSVAVESLGTIPLSLGCSLSLIIIFSLVELALVARAATARHGAPGCVAVGALVAALVAAAGEALVVALVAAAVEAWGLVPWRLVVTNKDIKIKPRMNNMPEIGFSHMTAIFHPPPSRLGSRSPPRYCCCARRMAQ
jgi:hypothetical protein